MNLVDKNGKVVYRSKRSGVVTALLGALNSGRYLSEVVLDRVTLPNVEKLRGFYLNGLALTNSEVYG